jgi:hypothetical protein
MLCGLIFGWLFSKIFVKITKNEKFCLTKFGTIIFGKKTGLSNQFVNGIKGTFLVILDLIVIAVVTFYIEKFVSVEVEKHLIFYFPFTLIVFTFLYNLIRKTTKISLYEWMVLIIIYLGGFMSLYGLYQYW